MRAVEKQTLSLTLSLSLSLGRPRLPPRRAGRRRRRLPPHHRGRGAAGAGDGGAAAGAAAARGAVDELAERFGNLFVEGDDLIQKGKEGGREDDDE